MLIASARVIHSASSSASVPRFVPQFRSRGAGRWDCNSSCTREIDGNCIIRGMKSDNNGNDESFWGEREG